MDRETQVGSGVRKMVVACVARACNSDAGSVTDSATLSEIGLDSLAITALIGEFQASFDRDLEPEELLALFSAQRVADVIACLEAATARSRA